MLASGSFRSNRIEREGRSFRISVYDDVGRLGRLCYSGGGSPRRRTKRQFSMVIEVFLKRHESRSNLKVSLLWSSGSHPHTPKKSAPHVGGAKVKGN
jgi:hypothetical protein